MREGTRPRTGRRPGESGSKSAILAAARAAFADRGYERTTIRGVAAAAGVDPALVIYFFGSKQQLFLASIELAIRPDETIASLLEPGLDGLGERLVRFYLDLWKTPETRDAFAGTLRSAFSHDEAAGLLRGFLGSQVIGRLAERLPAADAQLRAELAASHLVGLVIARFIVRVEPLASAEEETIIAWIGPTIQRYLTGTP